ncbi:sulfatase [Sinomicrobium soli]|uniref:sulfatase n=1 Tax=Sinomicrobium sp. N-1-3-6 TaxID=2219864 RepID=UPI00191C6721|nr:sulfatase [Sinomicrobium sp. N-1-3-6]
MKKIIFLFSVSAITAFGCSTSEKQSRPNILILYADDLGWSDIGCFGNNDHDTPSMNQLASEGIKYTNAYAPAPICSASRASIITGKSPARLHFEFVATEARISDKPLLPPKRTLELPLEEITLGEIAEKAGYNTAYFGKWHIAKHNGKYLKWSNTHGPLQQGFATGSDHYGSHPYDERNRIPAQLKEGEFPIDTLVQKAIGFLKKQQQEQQPFFMFFSSYYVHTPVIPNNSWLIEKYRKRMPGASEDRIKYAAFVETMDYYYGQILKALKHYGLEKNTVVIFTSDNGGHPKYTDNAPLRGNKWNLYEGGIREPFMVKWPGVIDKNTESSEPVIQWDIMPTLCELMEQPDPENTDGKSLLPLWTGKIPALKRKSLYWHFPYYHPPKSYEGTKPCSAIRQGDYKLIYFYEDKQTELYDLANDIGESTDLSSEMPEITEKLKALLMKHLKKANARFAIPNPEFPERKIQSP